MNKNRLASLLAIAIVSFFHISTNAQSIGDHRSVAPGGAWGTAATWEKLDSSLNWVAATTAPPTTAAVYIKNGHTVTISATTQVKKLIVESGATFTTDGTARGIRLMDSLINLGTVGGSASTARVSIEAFNATFDSKIIITGGGTYYLGLIRGNQVNTKLELIIDADINLLTGLSGFYTASTASLGNTANQFDDDVTITLNAGRTIAGGSSCYLHIGSSPSTLLTEYFGKYTYNINGTMTLGGTSCIIGHDSIAASVITVNVNGKLQLGTALRSVGAGAAGWGLGTCILNIGTNGVVDGSRCTNFVANNANQGKNAFFNITGNGKLIQKPNTASSSTATFNVGVNGIYSPVKLTGAATTDTFAVSVKNVADNGLMIVKKQWTITQPTPAAINVTVALGWQTEDHGTGFNPASPLNIYNWNATGNAWVTNAATINTANGTNATPYYATITTAAATFPDGVYQVGNQAPTSLPLNFVSFYGSLVNGAAQLNWVTTNEVNTQSFVVERSTDGINFQAIGTVAAYNTSGTNNYSFSDANPIKGNSYYRLKQTDKDGQFSFSKQVLIKNDNNVTLSVSPNPAPSQLTISFAAAETTGTIKLVSLNGKTVAVRPFAKGTTKVLMDVSKLAVGYYNVIVNKEAGQLLTSSFIKQ